MPTFKTLVGKQKEDKTFSVTIQLTHLRQKKYINTGHYVARVMLKPAGKDKFILKDEYVINACNLIIVGYRDKLLKLPNIINLSASQLKDYLTGDDTKKAIDFIAYGRKFASSQNKTTGDNTKVVINRLIDFLGYENLDITDINLALLNSFVEYLRQPHRIKRLSKQAKAKPLTETAIANYLGKIKQIFRAAVDEYNDEDLGKILIPYYPFRKFKMPKNSIPKKRNIKGDAIITIRDTGDLSKSISFGRDIFMLSFYLVGINAKDLFNATELKDGRLIYYRAKTLSRKSEKSLVSIKVEPEALQIIEKYRDPKQKRIFNFYLKYNNTNGFTQAVNRGLNLLCKEVKINEKITTYYARHSWATIARNTCKILKDDIGFALNHSDGSNKTTDLYIEEDYSIVDEANRKVLDTFRNL